MMQCWRNGLGWVLGLASVLAPAVALAEGAGGGYKGIAQIYYTFIAAILIYGVHDIFRSKKVTIGAAIVIPVVLYGFLLPKG
jgi:uncharacterized membrane protein